MLKFTERKVVEVYDWDKLVEKTYGKPYNFQQQEDCQARGTRELTVPDDSEDFENDTLPYKINGDEMGVSFKAWLETPVDKYEHLFWIRNFYPDLQTIANDLHARGLIEAGEYSIDIDW